MERILIVIGLTIAILPLVVAIVGAQGGTWVSGIAVQNLSATNDATVTITFYNQDGTVAHSFSTVISAGGQKTWYLPAHVPGLPDSFIGSAVVSSDQPVAALVNTQVPTTGTGTKNNPNRVGASTGVINPGPKAYLPHVMKNAWDRWNAYIAVQNAGASATTVTVHYYDATGAEVDTDTQTIQAYASYIFRLEDDTELSDGFYGSAVVDGGGQNIAVICNFYNKSTDHATAQFHSYNGLSSGGTKLYAPAMKRNYYNYNSGYKVQNIGTAPTRIKATWYFAGNTYVKTSGPIAPGQAWGFYLPAVPELDPIDALPVGQRTGSAIFESLDGQPIIAIVNEDNRVDPSGRGATYNAFVDGEQTTTVFFPKMDAEYYGYSGGIQIQNVGTAPANLTIKYSGKTPFTVTGLAPGASWSQFAPNAPGMMPGHSNDSYTGSVTVESTQPIFGVANISFRYDVDTRYGMNYGDSFTYYNGLNQ
jgi:hypothetical protein